MPLSHPLSVNIDYNDILEKDTLLGDGFQIMPKKDCPHSQKEVQPQRLPAANEVADLLRKPCSLCNELDENMICAFCMTVCCGRHARSHMIKHHERTNHCIVIGVQDLSFWCYKCEAYLDPTYMPEVAYVYNELHLGKFNEPAPGVERMVESVAQTIEPDLPRHISGLWASNSNPLRWTVAIVPRDPHPNVFGSGLERNSDGTFTQYIIRGNLDNVTRNVEFIAKEINGNIRKFEGKLKLEDNAWTFRGTWAIPEIGFAEEFVLQMM